MVRRRVWDHTFLVGFVALSCLVLCVAEEEAALVVQLSDGAQKCKCNNGATEDANCLYRFLWVQPRSVHVMDSTLLHRCISAEKGEIQRNSRVYIRRQGGRGRVPTWMQKSLHRRQSVMCCMCSRRWLCKRLHSSHSMQMTNANPLASRKGWKSVSFRKRRLRMIQILSSRSRSQVSCLLFLLYFISISLGQDLSGSFPAVFRWSPLLGLSRDDFERGWVGESEGENDARMSKLVRPMWVVSTTDTLKMFSFSVYLCCYVIFLLTYVSLSGVVQVNQSQVTRRVVFDVKSWYRVWS